MITNSELTIYHKGLDSINKIEIWTRFNYDNVWFFGSRNARIDKGHDNDNSVEVRIPYKKNDDLNILNFGIGDIIIGQHVNEDIQTPKDLNNYEMYYITSINNNTFGTQPHIHLGGK